MSYEQVKKALADGADPDMLCMTCPWDRNCITPPDMTAGDIQAHIDKARRQDEQNKLAGRGDGFPVGTLLTSVVMAGRDTSAQICPVLAMRLKLPEGREVVDLIKNHMQSRE